MAEEKDLLDILLDRNNKELITLYDEDDVETVFEQVAVIPRKTKKGRDLYVVLRPMTEREDLDNEKVQIFRVEADDEGESMLCIEEDEKIRKYVYLQYLILLDKGE